VVAPDGSAAGEAPPVPFTVGPGGEVTLTQAIDVPKPRLWSPDTPELYSLVSVVRREGAAVDSVATTFGIRTVAFDKDSGFILNGRRVPVKGVCCHQDHAGVGSALPDRLQYFRIGKLKEMGANAYRSSHNPPTPELLEACDRLGMLVLDENRLMGSAPGPAGHFRKLILRDRNHPSVILWSIGNEEWAIQNTAVGERIARELLSIQRELDPTRVSTYAANNGTQFSGINGVIPVRGFNYMNIGDIDLYRKEHPDQPLLGTEEASTLCTRGVYATDTVRGYMEDHDITGPSWGSTAEAWWSFYAARPWLAGGFVWTGFDYRGEPTPYGWPCISSHFGVMDVCGFPKNNFYYYKAWWSPETVLQLSPHWNWRGREGDTIRAWVNSNCDSVELFLDGRSLGKKRMPSNGHLEWDVAYRPGTLEARGERGGTRVAAKVETTGPPAAVKLVPDRKSIRADREDLSVITVVALDSRGREVPDAADRVSFSLDGPGRIIGVGNGDPSSHEPDALPGATGWGRSLFSGRCQVIVQAGDRPGKITLGADAPGLRGSRLVIDAMEVPAALRRPSVPAWEPPTVRHLGTGKKASYAAQYSHRYPGSGLLDGLLGSDDFRDGAWQGFEGNDLDITVDLGRTMEIGKVTVGVLSENASWIFYPLSVEVRLSDDKAGFLTAGSAELTPPAGAEPPGVKRVRVETGGKKGRYVRIVAKSVGRCPPWHRGAGEKAWLFVDEVAIE
jgi:beta-galactosidase